MTRAKTKNIPDCDLVVAGFPCQSFSPLGKRGGFKDPRGVLYKHLVRIIRAKQPWAFIFENVPQLARVPGFEKIANDFKKIGYSFSSHVYCSSLVWPQHRPRLFMVGYADGVEHEFKEIKPRRRLNAYDLLDAEPEVVRLSERHWRWLEGRRRSGATGSRTWRFLGTVCPAICTTNGDRLYVPMPQGLPRYFTGRERLRLMGFPDSFDVGNQSRTQTIRQAGNSVVIPLVREIAKQLREVPAAMAA